MLSFDSLVYAPETRKHIWLIKTCTSTIPRICNWRYP